MPEIPDDRASFWLVDEDDNWVETTPIIVNPQGNYDNFDPAMIPPFKDGLPLGGVWKGTGSADDFTVRNDEEDKDA